MSRTMTVEVLSPGWIETFADVVRVRLEVLDGSRGVLPGHEVSRAQIVAGPVELTFVDGSQQFLATEGGLAWLDGDGVRLATTWASVADDLSSLAKDVRGRGRVRAEAEQDARTVAQRHEKAAQRALVALRRGGRR